MLEENFLRLTVTVCFQKMSASETNFFDTFFPSIKKLVLQKHNFFTLFLPSISYYNEVVTKQIYFSSKF